MEKHKATVLSVCNSLQVRLLEYYPSPTTSVTGKYSKWKIFCKMYFCFSTISFKLNPL